MRTLIRATIIIGTIGVAGAASYGPVVDYWNSRSRVDYRAVSMTRGDIAEVVNATGTVKPIRSVQVGSFVSGPIEELFVDFNQPVKKGESLARIDTRIYRAAVARDQAILGTRKAEVERIRAELQQAISVERRALALQARNKDYVSPKELDELKYQRQSYEARLELSEAAVREAEANLENSEANLAYTEIRSPVDGVVIERVVDQGQTVAAVFQTPKLFVVAPDMEKEMHIHASVDEADIGMIREAKDRGQPVRFTVDAYPGQLFEGKVLQIRVSSTTTQNVVTYPVVISASNPELKLLPGMTANISFQTDQHKNVLRIPNAALRFYPKPELVRPADRKLLQGGAVPGEAEGVLVSSAAQRAEASRNGNRRHVWVSNGNFLQAVEVVTGLSDDQFTELASGNLKDGQQLVAGIED